MSETPLIKQFLNEDFLLATPSAILLYHEYAKSMPIIDYHNHLSPQYIATDHKYSNLTEAWLHGDHYKWRAMRTLGINEDYITGKKSDHEKFNKWADTVPYTMRNPLYHWTHLELRRYFGINELLNTQTCDGIYNKCNEVLQQPSHSVQGLLNMQNVKVLCTTDDPTDDLKYHEMHARQKGSISMLPTFRPDRFINIESESFTDSIEQLMNASNIEISSFEEVIDALKVRAEYFHAKGCRMADHGLSYIPEFYNKSEDINLIFQSRMNGHDLSQIQIDRYKAAILYELCLIYHKMGWAQQFHLGAMRNNNKRALASMGADTGWDSIGDWPQAKALSNLLGKLDQNDNLAKTIIYNLNPADNEIFASMIGNFNDGSVKGKIQYGSGWWFLDQKDGMEKQINALSNMGLISCFIGMLTDSRSFLSFPRHEYFRRILCNVFGKEIDNGELPYDIPWIGKIIQDICYYNVQSYLNIKP